MSTFSSDGASILLAEDDRATRDAIKLALRLEGYNVNAVNDGMQALQALENNRPDVIVLDLMMPNVDGLTVCRRIRARHDHTPLLMLTARAELSDRVSGLDAGADDYLPKPFSLEELLARLRALLRRRTYDEPSSTITLGDLVINESARSAFRNDRELVLSKTEFDLLQLLAHNANKVLNHTMIYDRIWGYDFGPDSKNLAVYIGYLRRKLEHPGEAKLLRTVRGVGYMLVSP
jgi:two-component system response regulator MprA